jgi:hypothetical protein
MTIITSGVSAAKLVGEVYKRKPIQDRFNSLNLKAHILGTNISKCKQLSVDQYEKFMGFLKVITDYAKENFVIGERQLLPLDLPSAAALRQINFDKLLANEIAMQDVRDMCVMPDGRPIITLKLLPKIYQSRIPAK